MRPIAVRFSSDFILTTGRTDRFSLSAAQWPKPLFRLKSPGPATAGFKWADMPTRLLCRPVTPTQLKHIGRGSAGHEGILWILKT